jgi:hypothetical protein
MMLLASTWTTVVAPVVTSASAVVAVGTVGWAESRKLRTQHRFEERRKLRSLIGRYRGQLLEAALDWDRRMSQLYTSREELAKRDPPPKAEDISQQEDYLDDDLFRKSDDPVLRTYGKFCSPTEYVFRSYVFRFLVLCAIARRFEAEAFFIDSRVARRDDFEFLKYAKSFLWAPTTSDLPDDAFPAQAHFPNDQFRPILDRCHGRSYDDVDAAGADAPSTVPSNCFDLARLDILVEREKALCLAQNPEEEFIPGDFGKVIMFFGGLRKPVSDPPAGDNRQNWDRLCVLHLLVMGFISEFGYSWQKREPSDFARAVENIVDERTLAGFADAIASPLGLAPEGGRRTGTGIRLERLRRQSPRSMVIVRELVSDRRRVLRGS